MNTLDEYLVKTESAAKKLFEGINDYLSILRDTQMPIFVSSTLDQEESMSEFVAWEKEHSDEIKKSIDAQDKFIDEIFAMSSLQGAILQIASMAIQKYSNNTSVHPEFTGLIKSKGYKKFCIGRTVRDVPIGLVILAGRNQYNHLDEDSLREPNVSIFNKLADINVNGHKYTDPAFDLSNPQIINYAENICGLLEWYSYDSYVADLNGMLK